MRKESLKKDGTKNGMADDQENDGLDDSFKSLETKETTAAQNGGSQAEGTGDSRDPLDVDVSVKSAPPTNGKRAKTKAAKKLVEDDKTTTPSPPAAANNGESTADEEEEDYEVEDIVDHKTERKRIMFLVRWKNYGSADDTWEPESSLSCPEIIAKYREAHPEVDAAGGGVGGKRKAGSADKSSEASSSNVTERSKKKANKPAVEPAKDDEEYEVDEIVGHKVERKKNLFLIRWKGYEADQDTWEKEKSLSCPEIVAKYKKKHEGEFAEDKAARAKATKAERANKEYEVSRIMDTKKVKNEVYYLIRWKNCKSSSDTWERDNKLSCPELIERFKQNELLRRKNPNKREVKKPVSYGDEIVEDSDDEIEVIPKKKQRGEKVEAPPKIEDYEVEKIVDDKVEKGQKFFLVKWKNYPSSQNTWQSRASLACPDLLKKYTASQSSAVASSSSSPAKGKSIVKSRKAIAVITTPKKNKKSPSKGGKGRSTPVVKSPSVSSKKAGKASKKTPSAKPQRTVVEEQEPNWEVEEITDVKYDDDGSKNFLIRWKGCDSSQDTWEPETNLSCPALINKFMNKVDGEKPRKKKSSRK